MTNKIWCLFSVANEYDQPDHNLVAWWPEKPSLDVLSTTICHVPLGHLTDDNLILNVVKIHSGSQVQIRVGETSYRLKEVKEGLLNEN